MTCARSRECGSHAGAGPIQRPAGEEPVDEDDRLAATMHGVVNLHAGGLKLISEKARVCEQGEERDAGEKCFHTHGSRLVGIPSGAIRQGLRSRK